MNIAQLKQRLEEEGCNPAFYGIGSLPGGYDGFSLLRQEKLWRVFYAERGKYQEPPLFESASETQACEFFWQQMMSIRQDHLVGFFRSQQKADALFEKLQQHGLEPHADQIPYSANDPRFRVFVVGRAIFKTRELLGKLPLLD